MHVGAMLIERFLQVFRLTCENFAIFSTHMPAKRWHQNCGVDFCSRQIALVFGMSFFSFFNDMHKEMGTEGTGGYCAPKQTNKQVNEHPSAQERGHREGLGFELDNKSIAVDKRDGVEKTGASKRTERATPKSF